MRKLITICLIVMFCASVAYGIPRSSDRDERGAFTGPRSGLAIDDNIKATTDVIHTKVSVGTRNIWYVDSAESTGTENGLSWTTATDTLNEAVDLAAIGDAIYIRDGHNEPFTTADAADIDLAGLYIIGKGKGSRKPTFDYDGVAGELVIGADNVTLMNLRFRASTNTILKAIDIQTATANARIIDCDFVIEGGTDEFVDAIQAISTTGLEITGCTFDAGTAQAATAIQLRYRNLDTIIEDCYIYGDYSTAQINGMGTLSSDLLIDNMTLINGVVGGLGTEPVIELLTGTVGVIKDVDAYCNVATAGQAIIADGCFLTRITYNETSWANSWTIGVAIRSTTGMTITGGIQAD